MTNTRIWFGVIAIAYVLLLLEMIPECQIVNALDNDKGIHNKLFVIKGRVIELNNIDLGETPAHGSTTLIFQKNGCRNCLIATKPDVNGNYEIRVGDGKYRIIVTSPSPPENDLLAPNQERFVDTKKATSRVVNFDVKLKLPN